MECIMICRWGATEYSEPYVAWCDADDQAMTYTMAHWMRTGRTVEILEVQWVRDMFSYEAREWRTSRCKHWGNVFDIPDYGASLGVTK
jgi:hypothetical protein